MEYQPTGGGGYTGDYGGGGFGVSNVNATQSAGGLKKVARRLYDESTIIPVTAHMILTARTEEGDDGLLELEDGRKLHRIKLVGATRAVEDYSTNVVFQIEDGTGLIEVKQWLDENLCSAAVEQRQKCQRDHVYVKIVGSVKNFDGKKMVVADSVRLLSTGNELSHHMLDVVYSGEQHKRRNSYNPAAGVGFGGPQLKAVVPLAAAAGPGDDLTAAVKSFLRTADSENGVDIRQCIRMLAPKYGEASIRQVIDDLSAEGLVYSTIDEDHYKLAME